MKNLCPHHKRRLNISKQWRPPDGLDERWDRLTYLDEQNELTKDGRPKVDEVVLSNATVHLESLSDQCFMLIVENNKHHWHLSICTDSPRSKLHAVVLEEENKLAPS